MYIAKHTTGLITENPAGGHDMTKRKIKISDRRMAGCMGEGTGDGGECDPMSFGDSDCRYFCNGCPNPERNEHTCDKSVCPFFDYKEAENNESD